MKFTLASALSDVDGALPSPAGPIDLVGYSMGGRIALHFAAAYPDRTNRLVLESASPGLETATERANRRHADEQLASLAESGGIEAFVDHWEALPLFATRTNLSAVERGFQRSPRLRNDPRSLAAALRGLGTGSLPSLWDELSGIQAPTLLLAGESDPKFVETAERMAAAMPRARVVVVDGAGHTIHLERPGAWLGEVVSFLSAPRVPRRFDARP